MPNKKGWLKETFEIADRQPSSSKGKTWKRENLYKRKNIKQGGLTAKAIGESIFTQGKTLEEIKKNIKEVLSCHYKRREDIPACIRLHVIHEETLTYA